jgi:hypothetical protein
VQACPVDCGPWVPVAVIPSTGVCGWIRPGVLATLFLVLSVAGCAGGGCRCELKQETLQEDPDEGTTPRVRIVLPGSG